MAKDALIKIFIIAFLVLFLFGLYVGGFFEEFFENSNFSTKKSQELRVEDVEILEFKTNKDVYGSYERVLFSVKIFSPQNIKNAKIEISGIKPYQHNYINEFKTLDLLRGENNMEISAQTPYCTSGCGGVYPGPYEISLFVFIEDKLAAESKLVIKLRD